MNLPQNGDPWQVAVMDGFCTSRNGTWFKDWMQSYSSRTSDNYVKFPIGIYLYMDRTSATGNDSFGLEPIVATTDLLKEHVSRDSDSWFPLGYMPEELHRLPTTNNATKKLDDYHKCLSVILKSLKHVQEHPPLMDVMIGNEIRRVRVEIFVTAVLGDGKSNYTLCTRVRAHKNTLRLPRSCLLPSSMSTSTHLHPYWISTDIMEMVTQSALGVKGTVKELEWQEYLNREVTNKSEKNLYQQYANRRSKICSGILYKVFRNHAIHNAFYGIKFLKPEYGIFGHTPTDIMHAIEEGIMKYVAQVFLGPLSQSVSSKLDNFAQKLLRKDQIRSHGFNLFPRCNFIRGFTSLSFLKAEERLVNC